jgi:hypothetical protein
MLDDNHIIYYNHTPLIAILSTFALKTTRHQKQRCFCVARKIITKPSTYVKFMIGFVTATNFVEDKKPPFAGISHFSLPQILILHRICSDRKSTHKLDICRRLHEGFVSCTKGPLFPVRAKTQIKKVLHNKKLFIEKIIIILTT